MALPPRGVNAHRPNFLEKSVAFLSSNPQGTCAPGTPQSLSTDQSCEFRSNAIDTAREKNSPLYCSPHGPSGPGPPPRAQDSGLSTRNPQAEAEKGAHLAEEEREVDPAVGVATLEAEGRGLVQQAAGETVA